MTPITAPGFLAVSEFVLKSACPSIPPYFEAQALCSLTCCMIPQQTLAAWQGYSASWNDWEICEVWRVGRDSPGRGTRGSLKGWCGRQCYEQKVTPFPHSLQRDFPPSRDGDHTVLNSAGRGSLLPYGWGCKLVQPLWRAVWRFLKKLKLELPYDPAICIYSEKTLIWKICAPNVYNITIDNSQDLEAS